MTTPEFEAHGRKHRSLEFDLSNADHDSNESEKGFPTPDDIHQGETAKYAVTALALGLSAITAVVAAKKIRDKRKGS